MTSAPSGDHANGITELLATMRERLDLLPAGQAALRDFLGTYLRTTGLST